MSRLQEVPAWKELFGHSQILRGHDSRLQSGPKGSNKEAEIKTVTLTRSWYRIDRAIPPPLCGIRYRTEDDRLVLHSLGYQHRTNIVPVAYVFIVQNRRTHLGGYQPPYVFFGTPLG